MSGHHATRVEVASGIWQPARPKRDTSWWHRIRAQWRCRRDVGHCWHADGWIDWWCCMCGGQTDGAPPQRCIHCVRERGEEEEEE